MVGEVTLHNAVLAVGRPNIGPGPDSAQPGGGTGVDRTAQINETVSFSSPGVGKYAERLTAQDESNRSAMAVRAADAALGQMGDALVKIKEALTQIIKQYPPYGHEDPERIAYLNSIAGLRKQIEALAPALSPDGTAFRMPGGTALDLAPYPPGTVLGIPELGPRAGDVEVITAVPGVEAALERVGTARATLASAVHVATQASAAEMASLRFASL